MWKPASSGSTTFPTWTIGIGTSTTWTGGLTRGSRVLNVSNAGAFSSGGWVHLSADSDPTIDGGQNYFNGTTYMAKVTCANGTGSDCSGAGPGQIKIDPKAIREAYREEMEAHNKMLARQARGLSVDFVQIRTDQPLDAVLSTYLSRRSSRARGGRS